MITLNRLRELEKIAYESGNVHRHARKAYKPETQEERKKITAFRKTLPGSYCYWNAIRHLIHKTKGSKRDRFQSPKT